MRVFDIRYVIAALLGLYGVVLTVTALAGEDEEHINLFSGLGMLLAAGLFAAWAHARPVDAGATDASPADQGPTDDGDGP